MSEKELSVEEMRELLVPLHLHYDVGAKPLKTRALAEIFAKVLFANPEKMRRVEIAQEARQLISVRNLEAGDINDAIEFLQSQGQLEIGDNRYGLTAEAKKDIQSGLDESRGRITRILKQYFPNELDQALLEKWFRKASTKIFEHFGSIWARTLFRSKEIEMPDRDFFEQTLEQSITDLGLQPYTQELVEGYKAFLQDKNPDSVMQKWSFAQAMLSARLVYSAVGPDPITVKEFQGAKLFLDTNALFLTALEKSKSSKALKALASALSEIGATLHIIRPTKEEYERVVERIKGETLKALDREVSIVLLRESDDPFMRTAISRKCEKREDFERFFGEIHSPPDNVDNVAKINFEEDAQVNESIKRGLADTSLQGQIASQWRTLHSWEKPKVSVEHDASLDRVVADMRKAAGNVWVITRDRSMLNLSAIRSSAKKPPAWLSLDVLIEILAIYGAGPTHQAEKFAPLLSTLIETELLAGGRTYTIEDLNNILDVEEKAKELDPEEVKEFVAKMRRLRLSGKAKDTSELQLEIRRVFDRKLMDRDEENEILKREKRATERTLESVRTATMPVLSKQLASKPRRMMLLKYFGLGLFIVGIGALLALVGWKYWKSGNDGVALALWTVAVFEVLFPFFWKVIPNIRKEWKSAGEVAEREARRLLKEQT